MLNDIYEMETEPHVPVVIDYIPEDIDVHDINGLKVGNVKYFQPARMPASLEAFPPDMRNMAMPDELILRLVRNGFIRVRVGFLAKDRYVFLSQIHRITDDAVHLKTDMDNLIKA